MKTILSVDGGGIRGIIPAVILAEIERRTGRPVADLFDLVAGTSTGGILALGLTCPGPDGRPRLTAQDMIGIYIDNATRIFPHEHLSVLKQAFEDKYSVAGLESVLESILGTARLSEAVTEVLVIAYEIERREPFFFRRKDARTGPSKDWLMRLVARATSAAPSFFSPLKLLVADADEYLALIDGGVFANNPAMCAYAEMARDTAREDIVLVSLGTGMTSARFRYDQAQHWGMLRWAKPLLSLLMEGASTAIDLQLRQVLGTSDYHRFQAVLDVASLDDARPETVHLLREAAEKLVVERSDEIDLVCSKLIAAGAQVD